MQSSLQLHHWPHHGIVLCIVILAGLRGVAQPRNQNASAQDLPARLAQANALTDLRTAEPYELHARIAVDPGSKNAQQGELTIYRAPGRSRLELQLGGYHQTEVVRDEVRYVSRSGAHPLAGLDALENLESAMHFLDRFPAQTKFNKSYERTVGSTIASCYDARLNYLGKMRFCFDPSGVVLEASDYAGWKGTFSGYRRAGSRMFPSTMELAQPLKPRHIEISDIQVVQRQFADSDFPTSNGALAFAACNSPSPARPTTSNGWGVARFGRPEAYLYAIVEPDGRAHDIAIYGADHKSVTREVSKLANKWSFTAAHCGGAAVASEVVLPLTRYALWSSGSSSSESGSSSGSMAYQGGNYWDLCCRDLTTPSNPR